MEDYSESSSVRMEREMMGDSSSSRPAARDDDDDNALLDNEASDSSLAAFNDEIQRMTRDADRLLNDILGSPVVAEDGSSSHSRRRHSPTTTIMEEEGDAELQEELEALDEVSRKISLDVGHHTLKRNRAAVAAVDKQVVVVSKPPQPTTADAPSLAMAVAVIWAMVLCMLLHAKFRLVDGDGYLRVLA